MLTLKPFLQSAATEAGARATLEMVHGGEAMGRRCVDECAMEKNEAGKEEALYKTELLERQTFLFISIPLS